MQKQFYFNHASHLKEQKDNFLQIRRKITITQKISMHELLIKSKKAEIITSCEM